MPYIAIAAVGLLFAAGLYKLVQWMGGPGCGGSIYDELTDWELRKYCNAGEVKILERKGKYAVQQNRFDDEAMGEPMFLDDSGQPIDLGELPEDVSCMPVVFRFSRKEAENVADAAVEKYREYLNRKKLEAWYQEELDEIEHAKVVKRIDINPEPKKKGK